MNSHWSDEDLLNCLYGIGPTNNHLEDCEHCRARWSRLRKRRNEILQPPELPPGFLASQRNQLRMRLESGGERRCSFRLAATLAACAVIVLGVILSRPAPDPVPTLASSTTNDSRFYTEIYGMVENTEPKAAEPVYALFEE